jgi:hypothetical protein
MHCTRPIPCTATSLLLLLLLLVLLLDTGSQWVQLTSPTAAAAVAARQLLQSLIPQALSHTHPQLHLIELQL